MTENDEPRDSTGRFGFTMMLVMVLLIGYPLTIGPVGKLCAPGPAPQAILAFYAPVIWVYEKSPAARHFLDWYAKLWGFHL